MQGSLRERGFPEATLVLEGLRAADTALGRSGGRNAWYWGCGRVQFQLVPVAMGAISFVVVLPQGEVAALLAEKGDAPLSPVLASACAGKRRFSASCAARHPTLNGT